MIHIKDKKPIWFIWNKGYNASNILKRQKANGILFNIRLCLAAAAHGPHFWHHFLESDLKKVYYGNKNR